MFVSVPFDGDIEAVLDHMKDGCSDNVSVGETVAVLRNVLDMLSVREGLEAVFEAREREHVVELVSMIESVAVTMTVGLGLVVD